MSSWDGSILFTLFSKIISLKSQVLNRNWYTYIQKLTFLYRTKVFKNFKLKVHGMFHSFVIFDSCRLGTAVNPCYLQPDCAMHSYELQIYALPNSECSDIFKSSNFKTKLPPYAKQDFVFWLMLSQHRLFLALGNTR